VNIEHPSDSKACKKLHVILHCVVIIPCHSFLNIELGQVIKKVLLSPNSTNSCKVSFLLTECVHDNNAAHVKNRDFKTLC